MSQCRRIDSLLLPKESTTGSHYASLVFDGVPHRIWNASQKRCSFGGQYPSDLVSVCMARDLWLFKYAGAGDSVASAAAVFVPLYTEEHSVCILSFKNELPIIPSRRIFATSLTLPHSCHRSQRPRCQIARCPSHKASSTWKFLDEDQEARSTTPSLVSTGVCHFLPWEMSSATSRAKGSATTIALTHASTSVCCLGRSLTHWSESSHSTSFACLRQKIHVQAGSRWSHVLLRKACSSQRIVRCAASRFEGSIVVRSQ